MTDPNISLLLQALQSCASPVLWLADEHHHSFEPLASLGDNIEVLSNRFDIAQRAQHAGLSSTFNDWQLSGSARFNTVALRVCKEKAVNLHLIQQGFAVLLPGGKLLLTGAKNDGIKTYVRCAETVFGQTLQTKKVGTSYLAIAEKNPLPMQSAEAVEGAQEPSPYHALRPIGQWQDLTLYSKPGIYGWEKIDVGSQILMEAFNAYCHDRAITPSGALLDLGCGYGYLSLACAQLPFTRRVATDNNAGAILATQYNAKENQLDIEVIAGNCGDTVTGSFDTILCNPPFHKGFGVEGDLTTQFLAASHAKLSPKGQAFFVVNSFIGIEQKAAKLFAQTELLVNTKQFKVLVFKKS